MSITTREIKDTILSAASQSRRLLIEGYVDSKGNVYDTEVEMLEDGGYEQLVKESLRISKEKNLINACPPDFPDKEAWRAGVAEQEESWLKSILGMHKEKNSSETLVSAGRFVTNPEKPDLVIIRHLREINKSIRVESPEPGPVSKPKTIAKKILTRMLPIGSYVGQLNLSPDKVTNVTVL